MGGRRLAQDRCEWWNRSRESPTPSQQSSKKAREPHLPTQKYNGEDTRSLLGPMDAVCEVYRAINFIIYQSLMIKSKRVLRSRSLTKVARSCYNGRQRNLYQISTYTARSAYLLPSLTFMTNEEQDCDMLAIVKLRWCQWASYNSVAHILGQR